MHYKNFKTAVYFPAWIAPDMTKEQLEKDYDFIEKYVGLDKVYLEIHRYDTDVTKEKLLMIKSFLEEKGVAVSGGITTTIEDFEGAEPGKRRLFNTFCYTDPAMRDKVKKLSEFAAEIFDEVILDDFYFTNCTCESCIKAKGDRDWVTFRRDLMKDVSENLIVKPAKAVNPKVNMIIKYPNWRESFHSTGYLPDDQKDIFDETYIGTETRSTTYTDQHLPAYLSYSNVRYIENAWPGRNVGGWFDIFQCWSADRYMEQGYLTAFAKAKELTLFQWGDLIDNYFVGGLKIQLEKIDRMLDEAGAPTGVPVYIPYGSSGENHLEMRLGMQGIPIEATPEFPSDKNVILLTESAAKDENIIDKLKTFVQAGGDAVITSGFLGKMGEELRAAGLTEAVATGRKMDVTRYQITGDDAGYIEDVNPVIYPEIVHSNNNSWSLVNGGSGDYHSTLVLMSTYGKGRLYTAAIPENAADISKMPRAVLDVLKRILSTGLYASGRDFSMFTYDDGTLILYRYVKGKIRPSRVMVYTEGDYKTLVDVTTGETYVAEPYVVWQEFEIKKYMVADLILEPGVFKAFKWQ